MPIHHFTFPFMQNLLLSLTMPFPISCKIISLFLFIFHTCANELNIFEPGTQVDTILSQDNLAVSAGSTTATFDGITDNALQQNDQHPSNPNPLLLASENPDCAASSSNIMQSPAGRRRFRMRSKRDGDSNGGEACEWQEFKDDGPGTTTPDDEQLRGKRRRPNPGIAIPGRKLGPVGPLMNPEPITNPEPAPYKLDKNPDPQKCPFGEQNIPVCYPKVAPSPINPALFLSPCRTGEWYRSLSSLYELENLFRLCGSDWSTTVSKLPANRPFAWKKKKKEQKHRIKYNIYITH